MAYTRDISSALKGGNETTLETEGRPATSAMSIERGSLAVMRPGSPVHSIQKNAIHSFAIPDMSDDLFLLPNQSFASKLVDLYFKSWGSFWPYINEVSFRETFQHIYQGTSPVPRIRLSMLNMAFALAIQRSFAPNAPLKQAESYKYYARAAQIEDTHTLTCATLETGKGDQSIEAVP